MQIQISFSPAEQVVMLCIQKCSFVYYEELTEVDQAPNDAASLQRRWTDIVALGENQNKLEDFTY